MKVITIANSVLLISVTVTMFQVLFAVRDIKIRLEKIENDHEFVISKEEERTQTIIKKALQDFKLDEYYKSSEGSELI